MNDDLVAKKFALYDSQLAAGSELEEVEQEPVMLPATVLTQSARTTARAPGKGANQEVVGSDWFEDPCLLTLNIRPLLNSPGCSLCSCR